MKLSRRILLAVITWFSISILVLAGAGVLFSQNAAQDQRQEKLNALVQTFNTRLNNMKSFALGLATEAANTPKIQEAFALRSRNQLLDQTLPTFNALNAQFDVVQYQYHLPPATSFLRLHAPENYGDDLSAVRPSVVAVNIEKKPVTTIEIGRAGIGIRGISPVFFEGNHVGSVEMGLDINQELLLTLSSELKADWQIMLLKQFTEVETLETEIAISTVSGPSQDFVLHATSLNSPFFAEIEAYERAILGETVITERNINGRNYAIATTPLRDFSNNVIGTADIIVDYTDDARSNILVFLGIVSLSFVILAAGSSGIGSYIFRALQPISELTQSAAQVTSGDFSAQANPNAADELGQLGKTFNEMTAQIRSSITLLEERVEERTAELQRRAEQLLAISQITENISLIQNTEELLTRITAIISERFGFYHVGIFLLDEKREYAILKASNSEGGKRMLARNHQLRVGQVGIVGNVAQLNRPRIALDVGVDAIFFDNPDLPETHSEMALPLRIRNTLIGVLDIQSTEQSAFSEEDIAILTTLATQVALAIENARLFEDVQATLKQVEEANRFFTRQQWSNKAEGFFGVRYTGTEIRDLDQEIETTETQMALSSGEIVISQDGKQNLAVPVMIRNETIGVLQIAPAQPGTPWSTEQIQAVKNIAERLAFSLENARLLEESTNRAERERTITEISSRIGRSIEINEIMQTVVEQIGQLLGHSQVSVKIAPEQDKA